MPESIITCPFCGLICDDLVASDDRIDVRGCPKAERGFSRRQGEAARRPHAIAGKPASLDEAAAAAAAIIRQASPLLIGGLSADLKGIRMLLALADRAGAIVDHRNAASLLANASVARASGWVTGTFGEVANRADHILIIGADPTPSFPRFFERLVDNAGALYRTRPPIVDFIGMADQAPTRDTIQSRVAVKSRDFVAAMGLFGAIINGYVPRDAALTELPVATIADIAARLKAAHYGVIIWDAARFPADEAEILVEIIAGVLRRLNVVTRCVGLPLSGSENGLGATQVMLWQAGWPMRVAFGGGAPEHDPWCFDGARLLAAGEAGALLWVAALAPDPPPKTRVPVVAIVADDVVLADTPAVEIRVGIPGVDHAGAIVRSDTVIALPLQPARPSDRPSVAEAASAILAQVNALEPTL